MFLSYVYRLHTPLSGLRLVHWCACSLQKQAQAILLSNQKRPNIHEL